MPGQGVQFLPSSRIPAEWDPVWFAQWIREVLALADTRNAIEGSGITITGQPGEPATVSASDDLQNLLLQSYVLATPSGFLGFERVLNGVEGIATVDNGANSTIDVGIANNGINLGKFMQLSDMGVLGNPVDAIGNVQNIQALTDGDVLTRQGVDLLFTNVPIWTGNHRWRDNFEVQLGTGGDLRLYHDGTDSFVRNDTGQLRLNLGTYKAIRLEPNTGAYVGDGAFSQAFATVGTGGIASLTIASETQPNLIMWEGDGGFDQKITRIAVSGALFRCFFYKDDLSAAGEWLTVTRSAQVPTSFRLPQDNYELQLGAGQDLRLFHDGTDSWMRNDTGILKLAAGAASIFEITAARGTMNVPIRSKAYTVATLPAGAAGDRAHVTDALAPVFGAAVAGGGAVTVPVYYTGAAWFVG